MELQIEELILRYPKLSDLKKISDFIDRNKEHLTPWENQIVIDLSSQLTDWIRDVEEGCSIRFFLFHKDDPEKLIGMINFTQIFRGGFQACYLGYKIDKEFEGKGYMFKALKKGIEYMFGKEKIHRIMSNFMPHNDRSASVLLRLGFVIEGYAKNYLKINGEWQDHILTALNYERWTSKDPVDAKLAFDETIENLKKWAANL